MPLSRPLCAEQLEERLVPVTWGNPWPDAAHLTLSFVPDGTTVAGETSTLHTTLNAQTPTSVWQLEVLRAFQTWAAQANINIALVADGGQALGSAGRPQGDSRFGDIRIAAVPMSADVLAISSPYQPVGGTWSGDIRLNSNYTFGVGGTGQRDLYTVLLQEAGHVLGLDNSPSLSSVMYEFYQGVRTGLSAEDISGAQALYGPRTNDRFEGSKGNNSLSTAASLTLQATSGGLLGARVEAQVTTLRDADWYKFQVPTGVTGLRVNLQTSGASLLATRVTVYDSRQRVVATALATDPRSGDLTIRLSGLSLLATYYVKVESGRQDSFGVGTYKLAVESLTSTLTGTLTDTLASTQQAASGLLNDDLHTNDSFLTAALLPTLTSQVDSRFDYAFRGSISDSRDVDYYSLKAPQATAGTPLVLTAMVWGIENGGLAPVVKVFDANLRPVPAELLVNADGTYVVQVRNAVPGATYFVEVEAAQPSGPSGTGNYFLGVDFGTRAIDLHTLASDTFEAGHSQSSGVLVLRQTSLFHFVLSANGGAVQFTLLDHTGAVVGSVTATSGVPVSLTLALRAGRYSVRLTALDGAGPIAHQLQAIRLTDPIGPETEDPTGDPATGSDEPTPTDDPYEESGGSDYTYTEESTDDDYEVWNWWWSQEGADSSGDGNGVATEDPYGDPYAPSPESTGVASSPAEEPEAPSEPVMPADEPAPEEASSEGPYVVENSDMASTDGPPASYPSTQDEGTDSPPAVEVAPSSYNASGNSTETSAVEDPGPGTTSNEPDPEPTKFSAPDNPPTESPPSNEDSPPAETPSAAATPAPAPSAAPAPEPPAASPPRPRRRRRVPPGRHRRAPAAPRATAPRLVQDR